MFEGFVASVLNRWLGKYVQDLDTEHLNVGIFSGEVRLTNLRLKPEALFELELPIEVKYGTIGQLCLTIPWTGLFKQQPITVNIEDIFILTTSVGADGYDAEKEKRLLRAHKRKILSDLEGNGVFAEGFLEGLLSSLANNIQLFVRNVHVRFEDKCGIACGLCIQGFSVETTNSKWKPSPSSGPSSSSTVYQLARLEAMSVYFNTDVKFVTEACWEADMKTALQIFQINGKDFDFILKPLSAKMKLIISRSSEARVPKLLVDLVVQDAAAQVSRAQLLSMIALKDSFRRINIRRKFLSIRPSCSICGNSSVWWKYAYKASLEQRNSPYTRQRIKEHRNNYKEYKKLYRQLTLTPSDTELRLDLGQIEDKLPLSSLVIAREHAKIELRSEDPDRVEVVTEDECWWSLGKKNSEIRFRIRPDKPRDFWEQLSQDERNRVNELLGKSEGDIPPEKAKQYIEHKLNLTISNLSLNLYARSQEVAAVTLTQFLASIETRPAAQAFKLSARAESFLLEGASLENGLVPILTAENVLGNTSSNFLSFDFEKNPLSVEADYGITLNLEPIELVYQEHAMSELISFFQGMNVQKLDCKQIATSLIDSISDLRKMIESHQLRVDLNGCVKAPHIIVSESGSLQKGGMVGILGLGQWKIHTDLQAGVLAEDATQMEIEERLYDRLHIHLEGLQLLFCDSGDEWRESFKHDDTDHHLLSRLRGHIVFSNSVKPEYRLLPRNKLNMSIATLKLNLSDRRIATFLDFIESIPLPAPHNILITQLQVYHEFASDAVQPEPEATKLAAIRDKVISAELSRQRTPDDPHNPTPLLGVLETDRNWVSIEASDEEVELWARTLDLPGFDDNVSPNNSITSLLRIVIGELVISLSRSSDHVDKSYLMLRVSKFCFDSAFMLYGPAVQATLGGVQLIDKLHIGPSGEYLEIVATHSDLDFISLLYRKVRSDCPDFKTHFHSVEQSLVCDVGCLAVSIHREAVITLTKYLQYISQKVTNRDIWSIIPDTKYIKTWIPTDPIESPIPPGATKFSYSTHISELRLKLCDTDFEFIELKMNGFESDCVFKANERMILKVYIKNMSVDDLSDVTLHPKLVYLEEDKVLELKYVRHTPKLCQPGLCSDDNVKSDGSLKVNLGRLHIVFLYKIIVDLQHFTEPVLPVGAVWQAVGFLRRSVTHQLSQLKGWMTRLHISILLNLPTFLIPQKPSSPNLIVYSLGELNVENFFKELHNNDIIDNILVKLENMTISRALTTLTGTLVMQEAVLEPMSLKFDIKRLISESGVRDIPLFDVSGDVEPIKIAIGQRDLCTFFSVWVDNLSEGRFLDTSWWWRSTLPLDVRSPTEQDDPNVKRLQVFLSHGEGCRKEAVIRFSLDCITVTLYNDMDEVLSSPVRDLNHAFCRMVLWESSLHIERSYDGSYEVKMALQSCLVEDVRLDQCVFIKKVFQSHHSGERKLDTTISVSTPPIFDMTLKQTQTGEKCVDILIEKIRLNLSVPFIVALGRFIGDSLPAEKTEGGFVNHGYVGEPSHRMNETSKLVRPPSSTDSTSGYYSSGFPCSADEQSGLSVSLQLRKPEVMLFATGERKGFAILFRCEILADWSRHPGRDALVLSLAGMQALLRPLPVILRTRQQPTVILQQCDVEIARSFKHADEGLKVTVAVSPIDLTLSVSTFATITDMLHELKTSLWPDDNKTAFLVGSSGYDLEDLWSPKKISPFCDANANLHIPETYITEQHSFPVGRPAECLTVSIPKVKIVVEAEHGTYRRPLILAKTAFHLTAQDWNSLLYCKGELQLQASYLNEYVGAWEPLIEPSGEEDNIIKPWELIIQVFQGKSFPISPRVDCRKETSNGYNEKHLRNEKNKEESETSDDESDHGMTFLKRDHLDSSTLFKIPPERSTCVESSDSEDEVGLLDKLTTAVGHLFTADDDDDSDREVSECEDSSIVGEEEEVVTEDDESCSARSTVQERAVFLKKHSDSIDSGLETEAIDRLATHLLIHSKEPLELSVTPAALRVLEELTDALSGAPAIPAQGLPPPVDVINYVGPGSVVSLLVNNEITSEYETAIISRFDKNNSTPSSPGSVASLVSPSISDSDSDFEYFDNAGVKTDTDGLTPLLSFPFEKINKLYKRITGQRLLIQIPGFNELKVVASKQAGNKLHCLQPNINQTRYHIIVTTTVKLGRHSYSVRSPLQLHNATSYAMGIYYKKSVLDTLGVEAVGETTNPFDDVVRLAVVEPDELFHVPLFIAYHCKLFILPAHVNSYQVSENCIAWQELASDSGCPRDIICPAKEQNDNTVFSVRVLSEEGISLQHSSRSIPNYTIRLVPPVFIYNRLPYAVEIKVPQIKYEVRIEAGDKTSIYFLNILKPQKISVDIPDYLGLLWNGSFSLTTDLEDKVVSMVTEQDTEGGNKQLGLNVKVTREDSVNIYFHSPYWIVNKTGLPLQLRGSSSDMVYEMNGEDPLLFCYRKQRRRCARLRAFNSSWSSAFSLDTAGCSGLVICKDRERRRKYRILIQNHLSQLCSHLTKIITFLPNFIVTNDCKKHLRFMEENERADLWIDIGPGQCLSFWPETESMKMLVKFRDSKLISQHFPITTIHSTVLRMDKGCGLTVDVVGGGEDPFSIRFRTYTPGDAPVRIDNHCEDIFLKLHQKELGQVALLSPYQSLLYTWDDPTKDRQLVWNVYNSKGKDFNIPMMSDGYGEERVSFHTVRQVVKTAGSSSSDDSDEDEESKSQMSNKTRKDKVVIYWASYIENRQRVLLLTQDERMARQVRRTIDAERSHFEFFLSITGIGISLSIEDKNSQLKELAYCSVTDSAAQWEVCVAHKWKVLTLELASWLEDKYRQGISKTSVKDYVHVDFEKFLMTKPFFGELRRRHRPGIWVQYRRSEHMSLLHLEVHHFQIDNQIHDAVYPTVLHPLISTKPCLQLAVLKRRSALCSDVHKFVKLILQEQCLQIERGWLFDVKTILDKWLPVESTAANMRSDISGIHTPLSALACKAHKTDQAQNMIEYLHLSPVKLDISYSPQGGPETPAHCFKNNLIDYFLYNLTPAMSEINSVKLKLSFFEIRGRMCRIEDIEKEAWRHYQVQLIQQLHVYLFGLDVLANPYSIYLTFNKPDNNFYEPSCATLGIPEEFSEGLSCGALCLLGHESGGPAGAVSLLATSLGTNIEALIPHEESILKKRSFSLERATDVPETLLLTSRDFTSGCLLGISGVVVKPNSPSHTSTESFFRGPGKGLMRLLVKPAGGVYDCLAIAKDGIKRTMEAGENVTYRIRPPRFLNSVLGVRPYSSYEAKGLSLLHSLSRGHYATDHYLAHAALVQDSKTILLVTLQHIFLVEKCRPWAPYESIWTILLEDIMSVPQIKQNKLVFNIKQEETTSALWTGEEKSATCDNMEVLNWLQTKVEAALIINMEDKPCV